VSANFYDISKVVSADALGVMRSIGLRAPRAAETTRDLGIVHDLVRARTASGEAYARAISDLGGSHLWDELAAGLDERRAAGTGAGAGAVAGPSAVDVLGRARDLVMPRWKGVQEHVHRPRPYQLDHDLPTLLRRPDSFSFPSGHTTGSYLGATVMAALDPANADHYWRVAIDTARSRVYGGVHFPTDVNAGARLGYQTAVEALARFGIEAPAAHWPNADKLGSYRTYGSPARDALAGVAALRKPLPLPPGA
jgi:membrane-associated phospholipid phosphatase